MKEKKTILLLSPIPPPLGGIASWTKHILQYYNNEEKNINFSIIHLSTSNKKRRVTDKRQIFRILTGIINTLQVIIDFYLKIKNKKPDIVHFSSSASFGLFRDCLIQYIIKSNKVANIIHFHFGRIPILAEKKNWEWYLLKKIISNSTQAIVIDQKSYTTLHLLGFSNINYIPNPIAPEILDIKKITRKELNINESKNIVFVGHVIPAKGVFELVKACLEIPNLFLELIGPVEDSIKEDLFFIASQRDNGEWLKIPGGKSTEYVIEKMISTNIFCLPSYTEGFPNVILESMACGCTIISTNVGAIPQMLNITDLNNQCGICIEPKDSKAIKNTIEYYINNPEVAKLHGNNARKRVLTEYNMPTIWKMLENIWFKANYRNNQ